MAASRPVFKRSYLNLDAIFGHVFSNVIGEPITPTKIATFYLIRIVFETHFGSKYQRSKMPLYPQQKAFYFRYLFALMTYKDELSIEDFRAYVRYVFRDENQICLNFYTTMERIGQGHADVNLNVEDEFYTNRHSRAPGSKVPQFIEDYNNARDIPFSSSQSFMYRWMKRILGEYAKATPQQMNDLANQFRAWIMAPPKKPIRRRKLKTPDDDNKIPYFLNSSIRAREWVNLNLFLVQKNPHFAYSYEEIMDFSKIVEERHRDVVQTHLLKATVYIQLQNPTAALECLKKFFDLSMFDLNENMSHASRTFRLTVPSQVPLLYGPILQARINRMFGDYSIARMLLRESIQQAQLKSDEICHQMANLELHILEVIGGGALLEYKRDEFPEHVTEDRRVLRKPLRNIDDIHETIGPMGLPCCSQTEDDFELCAEMDSLTKMLMMLRTISHSRYQLSYDDVAETGLRCGTGHDYEGRGKKIEAYGYAIMTSNLIRNGMYDQAMTAAEEILVSNFYHCLSNPFFETESWAVAACNYAYGLAGKGQLYEAQCFVFHMEESFDEALTWQCYRHVRICAAVIKFEHLFLLNRYNDAVDVIGVLKDASEIEYGLRYALVMAATGRRSEALRVLQNLKTDDVRCQMRIHMQLASFYNFMGEHEKCNIELNDAMKLAMGTTLKDIRAMIRRRQATMQVYTENYEEALETLDACGEEVENYCAFTEKCAFYMTTALALRKSGKDPRKWLKMARYQVKDCQWPSLEKLVMTELAALHSPDGLFPDEDKLSKVKEQFGKINFIYGGHCDWLLI